MNSSCAKMTNWKVNVKAWYENGQICEQFVYKDGKLEGGCKLWHEKRTT